MAMFNLHTIMKGLSRQFISKSLLPYNHWIVEGWFSGGFLEIMRGWWPMRRCDCVRGCGWWGQRLLACVKAVSSNVGALRMTDDWMDGPGARAGAAAGSVLRPSAARKPCAPLLPPRAGAESRTMFVRPSPWRCRSGRSQPRLIWWQPAACSKARVKTGQQGCYRL